MLRRTRRIAIEFGEQAKKHIVSSEYGKQVIPRKRWARGPPHRTTDSNRLVNMPAFSYMVKEIDHEYLTENGMTLENIRWLDERKIKWNCARCGHSYRMHVSGRTKNGKGCHRCFSDIPSVTNHSLQSTSVRDFYGNASNPFDKTENGEFLQNVDAASRRVLNEIVCSNCNAKFKRSIRCITGVVCEGQTQVQKQEVCDSCLWTTKVMQKANG